MLALHKPLPCVLPQVLTAAHGFYTYTRTVYSTLSTSKRVKEEEPKAQKRMKGRPIRTGIKMGYTLQALRPDADLVHGMQGQKGQGQGQGQGQRQQCEHCGAHFRGYRNCRPYTTHEYMSDG